MGKIRDSRTGRTALTAGAEFVSAGAWAMIDAQSLSDNAGLVAGFGVFVLIVTWFWDQVSEFIDWKRGNAESARDRWMPLHSVLSYIAKESEWGFLVEPDTPRNLNGLLENQLLERLARGDLKARGIEIEGFQKDVSRSTKPIPNDFWETAFIQPFGEIAIADDNRCAASRDGSFNFAPARSYRAVVVDGTSVHLLWPKAKKALVGKDNALTIGERYFHLNEFDENGKIRSKMHEAMRENDKYR